MDYSDEVWHSLKGIKGVVGFIGSKGNPSVLSEAEVDVMKQKVSSTEAKPKISFEKGTKVRIVSGSFADFYGVVKLVEYDKNKARVAINIFNRETEMDLDLTLLELAK